MARTTSVYLQDIQESIERIESYVRDINKQEFLEDVQVQDAVARRFEIIGEATKGLPDEFRQEHDHVPWKAMAGMRDVLIHQYFGLNVDRVWRVIEKDLPELKQHIDQIISNLNSEESS